MEPKEAKPTRKPWQLSELAWTAGAIAAVCCLLHSVYAQEAVYRPISIRAWTTATGLNVPPTTYVRIGWPLSFAEGKKPDSENDENWTKTQVLLHLTGIKVFPLGAAVDLLVLAILCFSAAYATERLKAHLRPQVTITGLLGISTLAAWEVQTAWKPSLAVDGGHDAARQIEMLLVGNWGYTARIMRFLVFVASLVFADIVARALGRWFGRRDLLPAITRPPSRCLLGLAATVTVIALLFQTIMNPRWHRSDEGYWNRLELGWPASALAGNIPDDISSNWLQPGSVTSGLQNISTIDFLPWGLATDAAVWALFLFTSVYGVNWLLKKAGGRFSAGLVCGTFLFLGIDACIRFYGVFGTRMPVWSDLLKTLLVFYNFELLQLLTLASCLFIPHMAFTLLGKLVSSRKVKSPRAEQAQTG